MLGEPRKGQDGGDADHGPEPAGQTLRIREADAPPAARLVASRLLNGDDHHGQRDERRHHRHPEHQAENVRAQRHEGNGGERPDHGADGIERLSQTEAGAPQICRRDIGDERVAGASRMPFPMRSMKRAATTQPTVAASERPAW